MFKNRREADRMTTSGAKQRTALLSGIVLAGMGLASLPLQSFASAHPNPTAEQDEQTVVNRGDVVKLPGPLKHALGELAETSHTYLPQQVFAEADTPSQLFQYYLLDTNNFEPNIFTAIIPRINDSAIPTAANGANSQQKTVGTVRVGLEPKPGLPTDPTDG